MSAAIQVSRDSLGMRLELEDVNDVTVLQEHGPYGLVEDENKTDLLFIADAAGTINASVIHEGEGDCPAIHGLRYTGETDGKMTHRRFGPVRMEADIHSPEGFAVRLPPLHERPWPALRENGLSYDVGEQIIFTLAERINDRMDFCDMSQEDAIKREQRKIPSELRRYLPRGRDTLSILLSQMDNLRLPPAT